MTPAIGASSTTLLWYLARATGVTALVLLTISMVLGIVTSVRWSSARWPRFATQAVHRNVSLLALVVMVLHISTVVVDGFAPIGWKDAVIPFVAGYRSLWLGFGAIAFDLVLALTVTSLLRHRIGARTWRVVHWLSYLCWPLVVLHGFGSGTDAKLSLVLVVSIACVVAVVLAVWWRVAVGWPDHLNERLVSLSLSIVAPVLLAVWLLGGPLASGWARKAGTPDNLLAGGAAASTASDGSAATNGGSAGGAGGAGSGSATTTAPTTAPAPDAFASPPFTAQLTGAIGQSQPSASGRVTVRLTTTLSSGANGVLTIDITGRPVDDGGVRMDSSHVTLGPNREPARYDGQVTDLAGTNMAALVRDSSGASIRLTIDLRIDQESQRVSGTVRGDAA
jgi:DMSO/TMAO reductase YedYZ heme-binding membrane subunit